MLTHFRTTRIQGVISSTATALLVLITAFSLPKPDPALVKDFEWSNPKHSIFNPTFSHSGHVLAFVQQLHIPDGHEAEEREGVAQSRLAQLATNKRLADPIVSLLTLGAKQAIQVDYGWNPAFSLDDNLLAYAYQQVPISEKRVLAQTLAGNPIKLYNLDTKKQEKVAAPTTGFLLEPFFGTTSTLYYKEGAATNGAFGGAVGLRQYNLFSKRDSVLYAPRKSFSNAHLIGEMYATPQGTGYLVWLPQDKGYGYMANEYVAVIRTTHRQLYSLGKTRFKNLANRVAITPSGDVVYLDDQHELRSQKDYFIRHHNGSIVFKKLFAAEYKDAYLSPDGSHALICPYDSEPFVLNIATFKRTPLALPVAEVYGAVWSADSKKLAVTQDDGTQDTDVLSVFTIPQQ